MTRLRVEAVERPPRTIPPVAPEIPRAAPQEALQAVSLSPAPDTLDVIVAAFSGLAYAISARAILALSVIGAFVLAVKGGDGWGLGILIAYCLLVVCPLCALEYYRRNA